jgi:hypothetical protein
VEFELGYIFAESAAILSKSSERMKRFVVMIQSKGMEGEPSEMQSSRNLDWQEKPSEINFGIAILSRPSNPGR